ncbi:hypothetical protein [Streptomyces sp. NPDC050392]|uniref:hypothetical protein n=1 Tax=Streptomyces sp. NPDC050392 TaxID=3155782 RepID=UPI0034205E86
MVHYMDNPAGRLRKLLLDLHAATPNDHQQKQKSAWTAIIELAGGEASLTREMSVVGAVVDLPKQVRDSVSALPVEDERKEHLLLHLDEIERGMDQAATRQPLFSMFTAFATGGVVPQSAAVVSLSHCSYELHLAAPEVTLSDEDLARIIELINGLMAEVAGANLPDHVKRAMLNHLTTLLQAAHDIRFAGTQPLDDALFALVGAARRVDDQEGLARQSWWRKFMNVVQDLSNLMSTGQSAAQVGQGIAGVLGG